jgi:hypothetical protein
MLNCCVSNGESHAGVLSVHVNEVQSCDDGLGK